jgi:hypothetical protein
MPLPLHDEHCVTNPLESMQLFPQLAFSPQNLSHPPSGAVHLPLSPHVET